MWSVLTPAVAFKPRNRRCAWPGIRQNKHGHGLEEVLEYRLLLSRSALFSRWLGKGASGRSAGSQQSLHDHVTQALRQLYLGCYGCVPAPDLHWLAEEVLNEFCFPCSKDSSLQIVWPDKLIKTFHFLYFTDSVQPISSCGFCCFSCICVLVFVSFLYVQACWH